MTLGRDILKQDTLLVSISSGERLLDEASGLPAGWVSKWKDKKVQKQTDGTWLQVPDSTPEGQQPFVKAAPSGGASAAVAPKPVAVDVDELSAHLASFGFDDPVKQAKLIKSPSFVNGVLSKFGAGWFQKWQASQLAKGASEPASSANPVEAAVSAMGYTPGSHEAFIVDALSNKKKSLDVAAQLYSKKFGLKFAAAWHKVEAVLMAVAAKGLVTYKDVDELEKEVTFVSKAPSMVVSATPVAASSTVPMVAKPAAEPAKAPKKKKAPAPAPEPEMPKPVFTAPPPEEKPAPPPAPKEPLAGQFKELLTKDVKDMAKALGFEADGLEAKTLGMLKKAEGGTFDLITALVGKGGMTATDVMALLADLKLKASKLSLSWPGLNAPAPQKVTTPEQPAHVWPETLPPLPVIPDWKNLTPAGDAASLGGNKPKRFMKNIVGELFLHKHDSSGIRATGGEVASRIGEMILGPGHVVPVKAVNDPKTGWGTVQPVVPNVGGTLADLPLTNLSKAQLRTLQHERVLDWVISNHDSKAGNFIRQKNGVIVGIDKEQAFKWLGSDKLALDYKPNPSPPIYNALYGAYADKKLDLDLNDVLPVIEKIESISDADWLAAAKPYLDQFEGGSNDVVDGLKKKVLARKHSVRADFEAFFTVLRKKRGEGPFTFATSTKTVSPVAAPAPVVPPAPAPAPAPAPVPEPVVGPAAPAAPPKVVAPGVLTPPSVPALDSLTYEGPANIGGAGEKHFFKDKSGKKWMLKVGANKGTKKPEPWKPAAQVLYSQISKVVKMNALDVGATTYKGLPATLQPWLDTGVTGTLANADPAKLTHGEKFDVATEHILDWLMSQHDSHGANLLRYNGGVVGLDKEQGFKYMMPGSPGAPDGDKLDIDFHPNAQYGENEPYYNKFWRAFAENKMQFDPAGIASAFDAIDAIPDEEYVAALAPYGEAAFVQKGKPDKLVGFLNKALDRKKNLRKDFEVFLSGLYEKRTKKKGKFTFAGGWVPEGAFKDVPAAAPTPVPAAEPLLGVPGAIQKDFDGFKDAVKATPGLAMAVAKAFGQPIPQSVKAIAGALWNDHTLLGSGMASAIARFGPDAKNVIDKLYSIVDIEQVSDGSGTDKVKWKLSKPAASTTPAASATPWADADVNGISGATAADFEGYEAALAKFPDLQGQLAKLFTPNAPLSYVPPKIRAIVGAVWNEVPLQSSSAKAWKDIEQRFGAGTKETLDKLTAAFDMSWTPGESGFKQWSPSKIGASAVSDTPGATSEDFDGYEKALKTTPELEQALEKQFNTPLLSAKLKAAVGALWNEMQQKGTTAIKDVIDRLDVGVEVTGILNTVAVSVEKGDPGPFLVTFDTGTPSFVQNAKAGDFAAYNTATLKVPGLEKELKAIFTPPDSPSLYVPAKVRAVVGAFWNKLQELGLDSAKVVVANQFGGSTSGPILDKLLKDIEIEAGAGYVSWKVGGQKAHVAGPTEPVGDPSQVPGSKKEDFEAFAAALVQHPGLEKGLELEFKVLTPIVRAVVGAWLNDSSGDDLEAFKNVVQRFLGDPAISPANPTYLDVVAAANLLGDIVKTQDLLPSKKPKETLGVPHATEADFKAFADATKGDSQFEAALVQQFGGLSMKHNAVLGAFIDASGTDAEALAAVEDRFKSGFATSILTQLKSNPDLLQQVASKRKKKKYAPTDVLYGLAPGKIPLGGVPKPPGVGFDGDTVAVGVDPLPLPSTWGLPTQADWTHATNKLGAVDLDALDAMMTYGEPMAAATYISYLKKITPNEALKSIAALGKQVMAVGGWQALKAPGSKWGSPHWPQDAAPAPAASNDSKLNAFGISNDSKLNAFGISKSYDPAPDPAIWTPPSAKTLSEIAFKLGIKYDSAYKPALNALAKYGGLAQTGGIIAAAHYLSNINNVQYQLAFKRIAHVRKKLNQAGGWAAFTGVPTATGGATWGFKPSASGPTGPATPVAAPAPAAPAPAPATPAPYEPVAPESPPSSFTPAPPPVSGSLQLSPNKPTAKGFIGLKETELAVPLPPGPVPKPPKPPTPAGFPEPPEGQMWKVGNAAEWAASHVYKVKTPKDAAGQPDTTSPNAVLKLQSLSLDEAKEFLSKLGVTPIETAGKPLFKEKEGKVLVLVNKAEYDAALKKGGVQFSKLIPIPPPAPPPGMPVWKATPKPGQLRNPEAVPNLEEMKDIEKSKDIGFGYGFFIDGGAVEHQSVSVQRNIDKDGKEFYRFQFKLREPTWTKISTYSSEYTSFNYTRTKYDETKDAWVYSDFGSNPTDKLTGFSKWTEGSSKFFLGTSPSKYAYKGQVFADIYPNEGESVQEAFKKMLDKVQPGLSNVVLKNPSKEEQEVLALSALLWSVAPQEADKLPETLRTTTELKKRLNAKGYTEDDFKNLGFERVAMDRVVPVLRGRHQKLKEKFGLMSIGVGVDSEDKIIKQLSSGTIGITQRLQHGIPVSGVGSSSPDSDQLSGGADYVYTRVDTKAVTWPSGYGSIQMIYDLSELDRLDVFQHMSDNYGVCDPNSSSHSGSAWKNRTPLEQSAGNAFEVLFRRGISSRKLLKIQVSSPSERNNLIQKAKAAGIEKVNGMSIEDLVIVHGSGTGLYDSHLKPAGY